ncbi:MAG: radical SAM protein [Oscillospiraceae bacterium]|nr:radical SAM protein [Oscillospiraceae bacterium]
MNVCNICPRNCNVDRTVKTGFCSMPQTVKISRAALHMWEEPCISGEKGSGTVFFSGCNMKCVFCQNKEISTGGFGKEITVERLADIFLELQAKGALNINLVTPTHYTLQIIQAVKLAKAKGLKLPIVYNTSSYEKVETIKLLAETVDIWLPDFKYMDNAAAARYSKAADYVQYAQAAIDEMVRQQPQCVFDDDGIIQKGVIVRHLVLPGQVQAAKDAIEYLYNKYGDSIFISIMSQYTPCTDLADYPEINRKITQDEYDEVVDRAVEIGVENGFLQEGESASESFIPPFDLEGVD